MTTQAEPAASRPASALLDAGVVAAWVVAAAVAFLWLRNTPDDVLRQHLIRLQFWTLEIQFIVFLLATTAAVPALWRAIVPGRRHLAALAALTVGAVLLTAVVAPSTGRIYFDEQIYENIGQNMSDLNRAQMCNDGNVEYGRLICSRAEYNKQPYGWPYLLSVAYRLVGAREGVAQAINNAAAGLAVIVVFFTVRLLVPAPSAAVVAGAVIGLTPHQLLWANTAASEPTAALAAAIAFLAALWFARERSGTALMWMVTTTVIAMQFRPESILIAPVVLTVVLLNYPKVVLERRLWSAALLGFVLLIPLIGHLFAVRSEGWGATGDRLSLGFVLPNAKANLLFYVENARHPVLFTALALAAILGVRQWKVLASAGIYLAAFFGIYLLFYAGSYEYGADVRYAVMTFPPLAILAGLGAARIAEIAADRWPSRVPVTLSLLGAVGVTFLSFLPLVRAIGEEAWGAREDVEFVRKAVKALPRNCYVLSHNPNLFHLRGVSAGQSSLATTDDGYIAELIRSSRYAGGIYFHWNYWCNVDDPVQVAFCQNILARYRTDPFLESRTRNYKYGLYRLRGPSDRRPDLQSSTPGMPDDARAPDVVR